MGLDCGLGCTPVVSMMHSTTVALFKWRFIPLPSILSMCREPIVQVAVIEKFRLLLLCLGYVWVVYL